jgi:23S rRNA pseudouridine1911/1915/1917 synthase
MPDSSSQLEILYEDNHLLAVSKPPGVATMGVPDERKTVLDFAKAYIKERYEKPGNVYLGVVSRLDAPVTGVLLFARTSKAASRLNQAFRENQVRKTYLAMVEGLIHPKSSRCHDWLAKDSRHRRMHVVRPENPEAKEAVLQYRFLKRFQNQSLLEIELVTGRKHQIRLQLASRGYPIVGDRKYGARTSFTSSQRNDETSAIALHAASLELTHPVRNEAIRLSAPLPLTWRQFGTIESFGIFHPR